MTHRQSATMFDLMNHPRKRQRRQAAALVVQGFFTMGKKSTAQPRPAVHVPPRGIGPIEDPNPNDVLCGRGGRINAHEGNVQFRDIVAANKKEYLAKTTKKLEKAHIAARIVEVIRTMDPPGRFLKEDSETGMWFDIGDAKAIKKAGQALREDAPDIRGDHESDEEGSAKKTPPKATKKPPGSGSSKGSGNPPGRGVPTSGRGPQQQRGSYHSNGSSSFGIPLPQHQQQPIPPPAYSSSMGSFPATASIGSAQHSLTGQPAFFGHQAQGLGNLGTYTANTGAALSKRAAEMMNFQQPVVPPHRPAQQQQARQHRQHRLPPGHPDDLAFGRAFTPTELSSGSTMSTISGMSGYSNTGSNMTGSALGGASALSLGSSGFGAGSLGPPSVGNSMRLQQLGQNPYGARNSNTNTRRGSSQVSDMTNSFMTASGLTRSPSFGELSTSNTTMAHGDDSSFAMMMAEDKLAGDILANMPPPNSSGTSSKSSGSKFRNQSSAMSVASGGSGKSVLTFSMRSVGSDNSWLHPNRRRTGDDDVEGANNWDNQSFMSDVSESIVALDLAAPNHHQMG